MRFEPEVIEGLLELAWWDMAIDDIRQLMPMLTSADTDMLRDFILHARG
jgi:virginiamycin A acetyltransferase